MADKYVANWGNDNNSGDSWKYAKRSLQGAKDDGGNPIYVKGYYNEVIPVGATYYGDGNTIFAGNLIDSPTNGISTRFFDIKLIHWNGLNFF